MIIPIPGAIFGDEVAMINRKAFATIIFSVFLSFSLWAGFGSGNYIPLTATSAQSSAGSIIVTHVANSTGNYNLTSGNSTLHYISTNVGDTELKYSSTSSTSDTKTYNALMISGIITCNASSTVSGTLKVLYPYNYNNYIVPCRIVLVKVSVFSDSKSYSTTASDWYGRSSNSYEVIAILDAFSSSITPSADFSISGGECIHVVQVPFANSNEIYFLGVNPGKSSSYVQRYNLVTNYTTASSSGSDEDNWSVYGTVDSDLRSNRMTLELGFDTAVKTMGLDELYANYGSCANKAASMDMSYNTTYTSYSSSSSSQDLYVTLSPYMDSNYKFTSQTTSDSLDMGFKITNFNSSSSSVYLASNNDQTLSSTSVVDTADYTSPKFKVTTKKTSNSSSGGWWSRTYTYVYDGSLSFDIYPYIKTDNPNLSQGDYSATVVVEFSLD